MEISMTEQGIVFLFSCGVGFLLGCFYDVFRIIRIAFNSKWLTVFFQDIFFCVVSSLVIILSIYYTNSGRVRTFGLIGCFLFFVLYHMTVGKFIMFVSKKIINFIKQTLNFLYSITIKPLKTVVLFIVAAAKKQAGNTAKLGGRIKNDVNYRFEKRKITGLAARGFDLYGDSKSRIPKKNMQMIKNGSLNDETDGHEPKNLKNMKTRKDTGGESNGEIAGDDTGSGKKSNRKTKAKRTERRAKRKRKASEATAHE